MNEVVIVCGEASIRSFEHSVNLDRTMLEVCQVECGLSESTLLEFVDDIVDFIEKEWV